MNLDAALPLAAAGCGVAGLTSLPAILSIASQIRRSVPKDNFYEDQDGKATPESLAAFSNRLSKTSILLLSAAAFGTVVALSVLSTIGTAGNASDVQNWLLAGANGALLVQAICITAVHGPVKAHDLGRWAFLASLVTIAAAAPLFLDALRDISEYNDPAFLLRAANLALLIVLCPTTILIPRRPDVFYNGALVDRQLTVSTLNRYTWSWPGPLLNIATKKGDLDTDDLAQPDHMLRIGALMQKWRSYNFQGTLLKSLLWAYKGLLTLQILLTFVRCVLGLGPFWAMRSLLERLERKNTGDSSNTDLWLVVIYLGLFTLSQDWLDGYVGFISMTRISLPMRAQLGTLVFEKSLKRKVVKSAEKTREEIVEIVEVEVEVPDDEASEQGDDTVVPSQATDATLVAGNGDEHDLEAARQYADGAADGSVAGTDDGTQPVEIVEEIVVEEVPLDEKGVLKTQQAIVNLVGVDARRISNFFAMQFFIFSCIGKLFVYSAYLIFLIGWIPFALGIAAWALVLPVNSYFAKVYMTLSKEMMALRDAKLALVNEALMGMRQIKFSALETRWETRITAMREKELSLLWKIFISDLAIMSCWVISPIALAAVSLAAYAIINGTITPSVAFVSIGVFKALEAALGSLPEVLTVMFDTLVSTKRVETYLTGPELENILSEGSEVAFDDATIAWPVDEDVPDEHRFVLSHLDLNFPAGELSVISGKTGAGKSLLLAAILGEVDLLAGKIYVPSTAPPKDRHDDKAHPGNWILPGAVAYVGQNPWLESTSFRENILFGLPLLADRYDRVLEVCALRKDVEMLTDGDRTELGANGINLSGGQKWRLTLARAIYSRAEILVMDDIFSAVDAHVGRQIFEDCINGDICKGRTRILVTHHIGLVQPATKYIVEVGEGTIVHASLLSELSQATLQQIKSREEETLDFERSESSDGITAVDSGQNSVDGVEAPNGAPLVKTASKSKDAKQFISEETREKGTVKRDVYSTYIRDSGGWSSWLFYGLLFLAFEVGALGRAWWLQIWTGHNQEAAATSLSVGGPRLDTLYTVLYPASLLATLMPPQATAWTAAEPSSSLPYYLGIYVAISVGTAVIGCGRFFWSYIVSIKASRTLFAKVLAAVLRTPMRWLDTVPVGRILNRMTSDFDTIDQRISMNLGMMLWHGLNIIGICVAALLVTYGILPMAAVLIFIAFFIAKKFMDGARPARRLESNSKSPIFELFNAALSGMSTVRAFKKASVYMDRMHTAVDTWDNASIHVWFFNRWLGLRMSVLGALFTTVMAAIVVLSPNINAAMAGFTLSFALDFSSSIIFGIRTYASLELDMNATERVVEYTKLETEDQEGEKPPAAWPTSGKMEVEDLVVAYADDLPPVLKGISFDVRNNERIGVVGRTGAGKSSLTLALFRFLEPRSGKVYIDGLDTSSMDLHSLRSRLAIIPQDPVLFSGTVRSNLDPFDNHTDAALRDCLARVHLIDTADTPAVGSAVASRLASVAGSAAGSTAGSIMTSRNINNFRDLSSHITESGGNLSQGQRQLLCLARAIVSRPKIMVLDEATSAVDMDTDALIQRSIREEFNDSTLLVIAHRLSTIADFDRILVLSDGEVAEFGTPKDLWETKGGIFRDMCDQSGESEELRATIFGEKKPHDSEDASIDGP